MALGIAASWWVDHPHTRALTRIVADRARSGGGVVEVVGPLGAGAPALAVLAGTEAASSLGVAFASRRVDRHGQVTPAEGTHPQAPVQVVQDADRLTSAAAEALLAAAAPATVLLAHEGEQPLAVTSDHRVMARPVTADEAQALLDTLGLAHLVDARRLVLHTGGGAALVHDLLGEVAMHRTGSRIVLGSTYLARIEARGRLEALSEAARSVVEHVALLGPMGLADLADVLDTEDVARLVDEAVRSSLVTTVTRSVGVTVAMAAPVWGAAVVDTTPLARRQLVHDAAARHADDPRVRLTQAVLAAVRPEEQDVEQLALIGQRAARAGSWRAAQDALTVAAEATSDPATRARLAPEALDAAVAAGELGEVDDLADAVRRLPTSVASDTALGTLAVLRGRSSAAATHLGRAWRGCNPRMRPEEAAVVAGRLGLQALCRWQPEELARWGEEAARLAHPASPARLEAESIGAIGLAACGDLRRSHAITSSLMRDHRTGPRHHRAALAAGWIEYATGDPDLAAELLAAAVDTEGEGSHRISVWGYGWLARARFDAGHWTAALNHVDAGLALSRGTQLTIGEPLLRWTAAQIHALRGQPELAARHTRPPSDLDGGYLVRQVPASLAAAVVCEATSDYHGVVRHLEPLARLSDRAGIDEPGFWDWHQHYANALVAIGRLDEADDFLRPVEALARTRGRPAPLAALGAARGRWHGTRGDLDAAATSLVEALESADRARRPYQRARILYTYGVVLRRAGLRRRAAEELQAALLAFEALGASAYAERCRRELAASGVDQPRDERTPTGLTVQEGAVAALVATGRTNREVAEELNVSVKTVQYHLTHIYGKLQLRGRAELAATYAAGAG